MKDMDFDFEGAPGDWPEVDAGVRRKILVYNEQIMMVCHRYVEGAIGPVHSHPHVQASYILSGEFELMRDGEKMTFVAGDSILMPGDVVHGALCTKAGDMIEVYTPMRDEFV